MQDEPGDKRRELLETLEAVPSIRVAIDQLASKGPEAGSQATSDAASNAVRKSVI